MRYSSWQIIIFFIALFNSVDVHHFEISLGSVSFAETVNGRSNNQRRVKPRRAGVGTPRKVGKNTKGRSAGSAPIYGAFQKAAGGCGCSPVGVGTWGSRSNNSCHPVGRAVDARGANCKGKTSYAVSPGFTKFVNCMRNKGWFTMYNGQGVKGLPRNKTTCHKDHAHFSKCCTAKSGKRAC